MEFRETENIKRGDIYYADLSPVVGSEQGGIRPVLIIQNNVGNKYSPTVIVSAITSQINKAKIPMVVTLSVIDTVLLAFATVSVICFILNKKAKKNEPVPAEASTEETSEEPKEEAAE